MQPPFHRLEEFVGLTSSEKDSIGQWFANPKRIKKHAPIRREGDPVTGVFFLTQGWVASSVVLRAGRRQLVKIHLPGDMLGFPSLALTAAGETLEALSEVSLCHISNASLGQIFTRHPRLAVGLMLSTQKERVALMQKLSWVGAASSLERLAAFILDLADRLAAVEMIEEGRFDFPLTQQQLGELLGLTSVHINRTLRRLDETGFVDRQRGWLWIKDLEGLKSLAPNVPPDFAGKEAGLRLLGHGN